MHKPTGLFLGFDFGMKRIGVAVGQLLTRSAEATCVLAARDGIPEWAEVAALLTAWRPEGLVVGIPYNMDNSPQHTTFAAHRFAMRLQQKFSLPVYEIDERLTTVEAKALQRQYGKKKHAHKIDSYAAKVILESWLREQPLP